MCPQYPGANALDMQAAVEKSVVVASIPSKFIDPFPQGAPSGLCTASSICRQSAPELSTHGACDCMLPSAAAAEQIHRDASHEARDHNNGSLSAEQKKAAASENLDRSCPGQHSTHSDCQDTAKQISKEKRESSRGHMEVAGLQWDLPDGVAMEDCVLMWLGEDDVPALTQLMLMYGR